MRGKITHLPPETATLITTDANELVRPVHDRMPVILQPADYAAWLGAQTKVEDLKALLMPLPEDLMERYSVSKRMSNARNEGEECGAVFWGLTFSVLMADVLATQQRRLIGHSRHPMSDRTPQL